MKRSLLSLAFGVGLLGFAPRSYAVTYVQVCPNTTDPGFYVLPGFEPGNASTVVCMNPDTGETRQWVPTSTTTTVVWHSLMPYPEGQWVSSPQNACGQASVVNVGSYTSSSFKLDSFQKLETPPTPLMLQPGQFITKIIMSGGFYDPRIPARLAANGSFLGGGPGLCVRSVDPSVREQQASGLPPVNPPFGNGGLPIGCIANQRIANAPLSYAISSTAAYQSIEAYFVNGNNEAPVAGPYTYGKFLVVTTDVGPGGPGELTYCDPTKGACGGGVYNPTTQHFSPLGAGQTPMAGTLNVWACVSGSNSSGAGQ